MNALSPDHMTRTERLDEVARLLALAILRRKQRMKDPSDSCRNGLDSLRGVRLSVTAEGGTS